MVRRGGFLTSTSTIQMACLEPMILTHPGEGMWVASSQGPSPQPCPLGTVVTGGRRAQKKDESRDRMQAYGLRGEGKSSRQRQECIQKPQGGGMMMVVTPSLARLGGRGLLSKEMQLPLDVCLGY